MKTAIDFYERGKLKEANADDYNRLSYYPRNRFICPECGEPVHLTGSKYSNFFGHYKKTDISVKDELIQFHLVHCIKEWGYLCI